MQAEAKEDVAKMIALQPALKFNGGGVCKPFQGRIGDMFLGHDATTEFDCINVSVQAM